jgi:hypothetical protein
MFDEAFLAKHEEKMKNIRARKMLDAVSMADPVKPLGFLKIKAGKITVAKDLPCPLEEEEQVTLAQFLDLLFWDQWCHIPNGGMRPSSTYTDKQGVDHRFSVEAKKMQAQGVKKGVPDVFIFRPVNGAPGVVVELKRQRGGVVSSYQQKWLQMLKSFGWITFVAQGADEAIKFIRATYKI